MASIMKMTSQQLYQLAKEVEAQERSKSSETAERVTALKAERKALVAEQRKEVAAIDRQISQLQGGVRRRGGAQRGRLSGRVMEMLGEGQATGRELRARLASEDIDATYLSQCLAGLKKQGKVESPERGSYKLS